MSQDKHGPSKRKRTPSLASVIDHRKQTSHSYVAYRSCILTMRAHGIVGLQIVTGHGLLSKKPIMSKLKTRSERAVSSCAKLTVCVTAVGILLVVMVLLMFKFAADHVNHAELRLMASGYESDPCKQHRPPCEHGGNCTAVLGQLSMLYMGKSGVSCACGNQWLGTTCNIPRSIVGKPCTELQVKHATTACAGRTNSICSFQCAEGFVPLGTLVCGAQGKFTGRGNCTARRCADTIIPGGRIGACSTGQPCAVQCAEGHSIDRTGGNRLRPVCQANGSIVGEARCRAVACPDVHVAHGGGTGCTSAVFKDVCGLFKCNPGRVLGGTTAGRSLQCTASGAWDPAPDVTCSSQAPTHSPSSFPSRSPTDHPTHSPTANPTLRPTFAPTPLPTTSPSNSPSMSPTRTPTGVCLWICSSWFPGRKNKLCSLLPCGRNSVTAAGLRTTLRSSSSHDKQMARDAGVRMSSLVAQHGPYGAVPGSSTSATLVVQETQHVSIVSSIGKMHRWPGRFVVQGGTLAVLASSITDEKAGSSGGAILVKHDGAVGASRTVFERNTATAGGGAVHVNGGRFEAVASRFSSNSVRNGGGAIDINTGLVTISGCTLTKNTATTGGGAAVALYAAGANLVMSNTVLSQSDCRGCVVPSALYVYTGAIATLHNVSFSDSLRWAIDCKNPQGMDRYMYDRHISSLVIDTAHCSGKDSVAWVHTING